jgi:hypothetical protein
MDEVIENKEIDLKNLIEKTCDDLNNSVGFKLTAPVDDSSYFWSRTKFKDSVREKNKKTEEKSVHSNPFNQQDYCPKKKRVEDIEKECGKYEDVESKYGDSSFEKGVKHNSFKLPMSKLFIQFPDALQAVILASCYGNYKYPTDTDWLNFKRVEGGSQTYRDAEIRHFLGGEKDKESNLPEIFHQTWNKLAELQLWLEENNINIKEFSENYIKDLHNKK